jgi:hypothetical protein
LSKKSNSLTHLSDPLKDIYDNPPPKRAYKNPLSTRSVPDASKVCQKRCFLLCLRFRRAPWKYFTALWSILLCRLARCSSFQAIGSLQ